MGAGRRLQAVLKPVDREAAIVAIEQLQMGEHAIGQALAIAEEMIADDRPVFGLGLLHAAEGGARLGFVHWSVLLVIASESEAIRCSQLDWRVASRLAMTILSVYIHCDAVAGTDGLSMASDSARLLDTASPPSADPPALPRARPKGPARPILKGVGLDSPFFDDKNRAFWVLQS